MLHWTLIAAAAAAAATPPVAKTPDKPVADKPVADKPAPRAPTVSVTRHSGTFNGQRMSYVATAGETFLRNDDGTATASIFSTAYVKEPRDPSRPVTFLYNGGPGSASLWLHMGGLGPVRVAVPSDAKDDGAPPFRIMENPHALLDVTDLVFIDPVGTGFSRALPGTEPKEFWGVTQDARSISRFIRRWLSDNDRWASPKFIGGESYGTTRSAALVNALEGQYNDVALNGVILISTILDFGQEAETSGNEMQYIVTLPTMAATAAYHGKGLAGTPVAQIVEQARTFATGPYLAALLKGNRLEAAERASVRARLAQLTGLGEDYLERADLRVTPQRFYAELLRDRRQSVGRLDARYLGIDRDAAGEGPDNDPSFYGIDAAYTAAVNDHLRRRLGFRTELSYNTIGGVGPWDWKLGDDRDSTTYLNVAPYLSKAMRENKGLRIFNAAGWYDFATPLFGAELSLTRADMPKDRVTFTYYDAGHMMYVHEPDLVKLTQDIRAFIRAR